ncbi:unnamed protein product [Lactuca saligna]|uniref:Uncharacterized protein n=1 Tax=Lactuca saligna TaxID=75948 RepID=A0AA35UUP0_LACSI|nr:unnamed protein product [Lactuca saligna]
MLPKNGMTRKVEVEFDPQKQIVVVNIPDADTTTDQLIPETSDQSENDDFEGFLDLCFRPQYVVPTILLNLNPRNRKASFSGGAHDTEVGSPYAASAAAGDSLIPPPKKQSKLIFDLNELAETWRLPIKGVREIMLEYNVAI